MTHRSAPAPAKPAPPSATSSTHEPRLHWSLRQAYGSRHELLGSADGCRKTVDLFRDRVEIKARAARGRDAELAHQRLAAVVAGADRDPLEVEDLRHVVRVDALDVEHHDACAAIRRRAVERDPGDV